MIRVQPDRRFGSLDQVIRISTVVYDSVMHGRAPWIAVGSGRVLPPVHVRVGAGTEPTPEKSPESQISVAEAVGIGNEPVSVRLGLIVESIPGIQRHALICRAEACEQRVHHHRRAGVGLTWFKTGSCS